MSKFGLSDKSIEQIHSILRKYPEIETAVIYGSRAKGNYREGSDVDLTLKGENLTYSVLLKIAGELDDSYSPYLFDLSIYHQLSNPYFIEHIDRVGQVFYQRENYDESKL
ncbi:nucleotidyltransferase domain-containing protein [Aggregatibacter actinomycetemcomitans]|uniref:nucleotidyltransferase domain-containing protein n=1 Tax=Aggregatibacter actinomycetemcomitans TaxID=714 RepID=UPI00197B8E2F|nr:nucleotidyltransferase domain-containing protein [Aggregatibacter actinomycetemcomitans]MBN6069695.1 nucleotidyltransferase domain-containing protein [Aggregatibacter actinomycetemcomitans]